MTPGRLLGPPQKVWGITVEKQNFFCKSLRAQKFSTEIFFEACTQKILTHSGFRKFQKYAKNFDPVLVARTWVSATKCSPLAKL